AETLTHATLQTLAERLTGGEARDLAAQLPGEFRDDLNAPEPAEPFGFAEFIQRVSARAGADIGAADRSVLAVFKTICRDITSDEFDDIMAQLPEDFPDVREPVGARTGARRRPQVAARDTTAPDSGRGRREAPRVVRKEHPG
ncbi:MAG TPA: DUF2267 domain-containing protein, partial [Micromonosporaceae bacterium]